MHTSRTLFLSNINLIFSNSLITSLSNLKGQKVREFVRISRKIDASFIDSIRNRCENFSQPAFELFRRFDRFDSWQSEFWRNTRKILFTQRMNMHLKRSISQIREIERCALYQNLSFLDKRCE